MFNLLNTTGIDTDGGVRLPAGYCGILGFRPSHGTVSLSGVIPVSGSLDTVGMYINIISRCPHKYFGCFECLYILYVAFEVDALNLSLSHCHSVGMVSKFSHAALFFFFGVGGGGN